jgi:hypothetical protein
MVVFKKRSQMLINVDFRLHCMLGGEGRKTITDAMVVGPIGGSRLE